jgi:serine/threonine-protein kinase
MAALGRLLKYALYASIFLGALLCSLYLTSTWIIQSEEEVVVPNLEGQDTVYALDLLTSLGLNIKVGGFTWSETVPKNCIAFQDPPPGTRCKRDRDVRVVLSRGSRSVRVPKLTGICLREAELVLSQNGLQLGGVCRSYSSEHPQHQVIAQCPGALQNVQRGQEVDLLVSSGSRAAAVAMPELRHRHLRQALEVLDGLGLTVATVQDRHLQHEPLQTVVGQRPLAGYRVDPESPVVLVVNRPPDFAASQAKLWWVSYLVPEGFFKKEIGLCQRVDDQEVPLYRKIHSPGERMEWLVWAESLDEIHVLVDGHRQPVESRGCYREGSGR